MKRKIILLILSAITLLLVHTYLPHRKATAFIAGLHSADEKRINALLPRDVSFHRDTLISDWYSFYFHDKLVIGPFPLENYSKDTTLNLRIENLSFLDWLVGRRSVRVFGKNFPKQFIVSYFGISYKQGKDPKGQAG